MAGLPGGRGGGNRPPGKGGGKGPGRGGNRGAFAGGLYQPSQILSGRALNRAAGQIANAQTKGPFTELARRIAEQERQGAGAQQKTFGYYMQLAKQAQDSLAQEAQIGSGLNTQLQGIQGQQQQALGQFGQQATGGALARMQALGLDAGQQQALQADAARQQATGAQNAATFQGAGAMQGANYQGMAASNLGTNALRGQERIGDIGKATQLAIEPLRSKQAALIAQKGALKATALGQLRSGERNYQIAQQGLGIKKMDIAATNARSAASIAAANARNTASISAENMRAAKTIAAGLQKEGMSEKAAMARAKAIIGGENQRSAASIAAANQRARQKASSGGGGSPLTPHEQNTLYGEVDRVKSLITLAKARGHAGSAIHQALIGGTFQHGVPAFPAPLVEAAYELLGYGHILPKTAAALHQMGLRGGKYKVAPAPAPTLGGTLRGIFGGATNPIAAGFFS